jgi:hypothetical protein
MKKKLFTLLLCAFAVLGAKAFTVTDNGNGKVTIDCNGDLGNWTGDGTTGFTTEQQNLIANATYLKFTGTINNGKLSMFQNKTQATTVDFADASFPGTAHQETFYQYNPNASGTKYKYDAASDTYVEATDGKYIKVTNTYHSNEMSFQWFENCTTAIISEKIDELSQNAFANCANISSFEIPENILFLATGAVDNTPITSINIPATVEFLKTGSIKNASTAALLDVTVNSPQTACDKLAFLKDITVGQTEASKEAYAVLHYPAGAEDYFINQSHPLTQAISLNKGDFQAWLNAHHENAGNGWQEFINSGSGDPIPPVGNSKVVLRTFSDNVARLVPLNFRAYIVNGIDEETVGDKKNYKVSLEQIFAIPANTGVILYGEVDAKMSGYTLARIPSWDDPNGGYYVPPYDRNSGPIQTTGGKIQCKNYLVPTVTSTKLYPYFVDNTTKKVTDRNFVMCPYSTTKLDGASSYSGGANDFVGFFRVVGGTSSGDNRAYLSLPADLYKSSEGAEAIVVARTDFRSDKWHDPVSGFNWGQRNLTTVQESKAIGEPFFEFDDATGVASISFSVDNEGNYYTLQGVKTSQPQKGVYIKNGRKVIVK